MYHIMHRGIRRKEIFDTKEDYQVFLALMNKARKRYGSTIYAYCLMTNHYHILIGSGNEEIWKFVKMLGNQYAMYFNQRQGYNGHLFEARYKSVLVKDDSYFLQCSRYIHLNPVKASIVTVPQHYQWSSYRTIIGMENDRITEKQKTLNYFKDNEPRRYQDFVENYNCKYLIEKECAKKIYEEKEIWLPW